ncbi:MAG TPA: hypothetical protein PK863_02520 [Candidatus Dojkabacteria bacterium]|nr:hypothetical protein [Candidatus Dojkabacteria bacterium]HRP50666.1 hypothetical protein [Candidatus Dojkabacteria bacterium]
MEDDTLNYFEDLYNQHRDQFLQEWGIESAGQLTVGTLEFLPAGQPVFFEGRTRCFDPETLSVHRIHGFGDYHGQSTSKKERSGDGFPFSIITCDGVRYLCHRKTFVIIPYVTTTTLPKW